MEDDFKLSKDETMRRLRIIAQSPGELQWRLDLIATLERMRIQQEVSASSIIQNQRRLETAIKHLTPVKLAALVNAQIDEKLKPRDRDVNRLWKAGVWILEKILTLGLGVAATLLGLKAIHFG
jgi:hypothetical protein